MLYGGRFFEINPCSRIKASDSVFVIIVSMNLIDDLSLAIRNVPLADTINQAGLNVYDVLKKDHILFTEQGLKEFQDRLSK